MKKHLFVIALLLIAISGFAQNGINYKAIIKDNSGNVIANDLVIVQFTILQGVAQTNVYQESHTPTTNANGLIVVNIGEGTPVSGTFTTINWASDTTFLNTKINTGAGLTDMGTTEFKTVPYALVANTVASKEFVSENGVTHTTTITDDFVVGSETLNFSGNLENNNTHRMFFDKSKGAFRAGSAGAWYQGGLFNRPNVWDDANVGDGSFASGVDNEASGYASTALGFYNTASGDYSTAMGFQSTASGESSFAVGNKVFGAGGIFTIASGAQSVAFGDGTEASGVNSTAFGYQTIASLDFATAMGAVTTASGLASTAMGSSTLALGLGSTAMGGNTEASGPYSTSMGYITSASGDYATALGYLSLANGGASVAMGVGSIASGTVSAAMGQNTTASGSYSTSMGSLTTASGSYSTSIGQYTTAASAASLAIGRYNVGGGNPTSWVATDPLLEVGFGSSSVNRLNAITVLKNGKVGIGTSTPKTFLHLTNGYDASLANGTGYFLIGQETGLNMVLDNNEILVRNNGAAADLYLQLDGGNVYVGGVLVHSSDRRLKKNISTLSYGLETILKLNPVEYNWKNREQEFKSLGLIAQEVQPIIKNIVHTKEDEDKTLSLSYTELIPVLIKAIQEQQVIINNQRIMNTKQSEVLEALLTRVETLEMNTSN